MLLQKVILNFFEQALLRGKVVDGQRLRQLLQQFVGEFAAGGDTIEARLAVLERWWDLLVTEDEWQLLAVEFAVQTRHNPKIQEQLVQRMYRTMVLGEAVHGTAPQ